MTLAKQGDLLRREKQMSDVECKATVLQHQNWKRETNVAANVRQLAVHTSGA